MEKRIMTLLAAAAIALAGNAQEGDAPKYSNDGHHKGLDFNISTGYHAGTGDFKGEGSIPVEIGLGKQFMPNLYVGLGTGAWIGAKGSDPMIPITADAKLMFPIKSTPIKPILTFRLGYLLNTAGDVEGGSQEYEGYEYETEGYEMPDFVMMEIMPGIQLPISKTTDFILSAGYTHGFATKGGGGGGFFTVKAGLNFHKDPNKKKLGPKREKVPTRNKGLQFTLEGGGNLDNGADFGYGFNFACTYKLNPHFSVGGGFGYEKFSPFSESTSGNIVDGSYAGAEGEDIQVITPTRNGQYEEDTYGYYGDVTAFNVFARGVYRVTDRRFSPFVSVDAGVGIYSFDEYMMQGFDDIVGMPSKAKPFVTPAIGISLRTTKNSYLELKGGYTFSTGIKAQKGYSEQTFVSTSGKSLSRAFISLGFTHTFGKRGKRLR